MTTAIPARITIDFRDAIHPSRTWILGVGDDTPQRVELIAFESPIEGSPLRPTTSYVTARGAARIAPGPTALHAECGCPDFCERDHANE